MIANLIRHGLKTDICLEIPDKGMMEDELETYGCHIYHLTRRSTSMKKHHKELADIAKNYHLYKPIADGNIELIKKIMGLYRKCYYIIAFICLCIGSVITVFVPYLLKPLQDIYS